MIAALKGYTDDPGKAAIDDFTPADVLYRAYLTHVNQYDHHLGNPDVLTPTQFGAALRRCFPELYTRGEFCTQRTVNGRRVRGYLGLAGPGSVKVQLRPGNRRKPREVD